MIFWIITTGEPLPTIDTDNPRLLRSGILAKYLLNRGHTVIRWTSTFDHHKKRLRFKEDTTVKIDTNYYIKLLHAKPYKKNISVQRLLNHRKLAQKFKYISINEDKPDLILCSLPTIEFCEVATKFGKKFNVPVVLDARDMWPDLFLDVVPSFFSPILKIILYPLFRSVANSCSRATALTGISEPYVQWELNYANRAKSENDKSFPHGYEVKKLSFDENKAAKDFWISKGVNEGDFIICLFTSMGHVLDLNTVFKAANILLDKNINVKFVLCGQGQKLEEFIKAADSLSNVIFPGWVNSIQIKGLMNISKLGILPYRNLDNYTLNIPNKPIEYMSASLPILSSVDGIIGSLIDKFEIGKKYYNGDPQSLVDSIEFFINNPDLLKIMSNKIYDLFCQQYSADKVYEEMSVYLEDIVTNYNK